jgi:tryptophan synthase beta chain
LYRTKRVKYEPITDREALQAVKKLSSYEGIIPALESAHAVSLAEKIARRMKRTESLIICLSGRGDKDMDTIRKRILGS